MRKTFYNAEKPYFVGAKQLGATEMTTTALMRYHQQQQRRQQQQQQSQHQSCSTETTPGPTGNSSASNIVEGETNRHLNESNTRPGRRSSAACTNTPTNVTNGNVPSLLHNGFAVDETINENDLAHHVSPHANNRNYHHNSVIPETYHNINNVYNNYHNNNLDVLHGNSLHNPLPPTSQKLPSGYGPGHTYPHQFWSFTGAQAAAQSAVLVATAQAVEAFQHADHTGSVAEHVTSDTLLHHGIRNHAPGTASSSTKAALDGPEASSLTLLGVPSEQNVSELAKKLLAEASSALRDGNEANVDDRRTTTITATTKIVHTTSISSVSNAESTLNLSDVPETNRQIEQNHEDLKIPNDGRSTEDKKSSESPSPTERKLSPSTFITLTSCRKSNVLSDSPPTSSSTSGTSKIASSSTSFTSISASSSSSSTPSSSGTGPSINPQEFAHPITCLSSGNSGGNLLQVTESSSRTNNGRSTKLQNEAHKGSDEAPTIGNDNKPYSSKKGLRSHSSKDSLSKDIFKKVDLQNLSLVDHHQQEKRNHTLSDYASRTKSSASDNLYSFNSSNNLSSNYTRNSHHQQIHSQNGSQTPQSSFQRSVEQVKMSI